VQNRRSWESGSQPELVEVRRREIASNSLIDAGLRIYDRDAEVGKEQGLSRSLVFAKMVYDLAAKSRFSLRFIAKI
jgi:hypothetical protein